MPVNSPQYVKSNNPIKNRVNQNTGDDGALKGSRFQVSNNLIL